MFRFRRIHFQLALALALAIPKPGTMGQDPGPLLPGEHATGPYAEPHMEKNGSDVPAGWPGAFRPHYYEPQPTREFLSNPIPPPNSESKTFPDVPGEMPAGAPLFATSPSSEDHLPIVPEAIEFGNNPIEPLWEATASSAGRPLPASRTMWVLGHERGLGWFSLENQGVLGYYAPPGLYGALGYNIAFLEGPRATDLPPRLYGFHAGFSWRDDLNDRLSYEIAVSPGVYADFEGSARDGFRIQGHGMALWNWNGHRLVLGIDYLDRANVALLPIAGFVLAPSERTQLELVFPRPRIARRVSHSAAIERWVYIGGEFGGDSWAVERTTGNDDVVTLNEVRYVLGTELYHESGRSSVLEMAIHTDRDLEFTSGIGNFRPKNTVGFRIGSRF